MTRAAIVYVAAALAEIGGCFALPDRYDLAGSLCCLVGAGIIVGRPGAD